MTSDITASVLIILELCNIYMYVYTYNTDKYLTQNVCVCVFLNFFKLFFMMLIRDK